MRLRFAVADGGEAEEDFDRDLGVNKPDMRSVFAFLQPSSNASAVEGHSSVPSNAGFDIGKSTIFLQDLTLGFLPRRLYLGRFLLFDLPQVWPFMLTTLLV